MSRIAIIGAGNVGTTLGRRFAEAGHAVTYGVRDPNDAKHAGLRASGAELAAIADAVASAELAVLATPWSAAEDALRQAGDFGGKPLLDATNPLGAGMALTHGHTDSGAEQVQRWATNARVVKVFNSTGRENMANPVYGGVPTVMFVCGDDADACRVASQLARDVGFEAIEVGKLDKARLLEPLARLWIELAIVRGQGRDVAFALLRR